MPTTEEIRERLARFVGEIGIDRTYIVVRVDGQRTPLMRYSEWQPDQDRNQIAMVEERLTKEQQMKYIDIIAPYDEEDGDGATYTDAWKIRTAPPPQCAQALYEVIGNI